MLFLRPARNLEPRTRIGATKDDKVHEMSDVKSRTKLGREVLKYWRGLLQLRRAPMAYCKVFLDGDGVRWAACPHLAGEGTDAVPLGFSFTSQHGERRALDGVLADCVSWEDFDDHEWRELLMASRTVRPRKPRSARRYSKYQPQPTRRGNVRRT